MILQIIFPDIFIINFIQESSQSVPIDYNCKLYLQLILKLCVLLKFQTLREKVGIPILDYSAGKWVMKKIRRKFIRKRIIELQNL